MCKLGVRKELLNSDITSSIMLQRKRINAEESRRHDIRCHRYILKYPSPQCAKGVTSTCRCVARYNRW